MRKISRKNISRKTFSKKNKKSKKNVQHYSKKSKINKMRGSALNSNSIIHRLISNDSSLTNLDISNKSLEDAGAILLAGALKENTKLTNLNISNNNIKVEGAKALAEALKTNKTLIELKNEGGNNFGDFKQMIYVLIEKNKYYQKFKRDKNMTDLAMTDISNIEMFVHDFNKNFKNNHSVFTSPKLRIANKLFKNEKYFLIPRV